MKRDQQKAMFAKNRRKEELDKFFGNHNRKSYMESLIKPKLTVDRFGNKIFEMESSRLDFKSAFVYHGVTPSGSVKLGEVVMSSPEGIKTRAIIAKPALSSSGKQKELYALNWNFIEYLGKENE